MKEVTGNSPRALISLTGSLVKKKDQPMKDILGIAHANVLRNIPRMFAAVNAFQLMLLSRSTTYVHFVLLLAPQIACSAKILSNRPLHSLRL